MIVAKRFCPISTKSYLFPRSSNFAHIWRNVQPADKRLRRRKNYLASFINPGLCIPPRPPSEIASVGQRKGQAQRIKRQGKWKAAGRGSTGPREDVSDPSIQSCKVL